MIAAYFVLMAVLASGSLAEESSLAICGRQLLESISLLCPSIEKSDSMKQNMMDVEEPSVWPWLSRRVVTSLSAGVRAKRAGLVEQCCKKPCHMHELLKYC